MKRRRPLRESRLVHVTVGASMLAVPASAAALVGSHDLPAQGQQSPAQQGSRTPIHVKLRSRKVAYGRDLVLTGHAPSSYAGQAVALQYAPARSAAWRTLRSTTVRPDGSFRLIARLTGSGRVRVSSGSQPAETPNSVSRTAPVALAASGSGATSTAPQRIAVAASLRVPAHAINVLGSELVNLRGRLLPGSPHRRVQLQGLRGGRWVTLAVARTGTRGGFHLRYGAAGLGGQRLRVRFGGDSANAATSRGAGMLTVYRQSAASWYEDGGSTACGFHAYYGVANLSLPCGTRVSFMYGGRTVTAVVDDRGPYVGGRSWDLNQNTAGALGVAGVQTVWSSS